MPRSNATLRPAPARTGRLVRGVLLLALLGMAPGAARSQQPDAPGRVSVRDYGAVGDGRADDTGALQRAVDAAAGGVWLPRGRYRLTRPVVVDLDRVGPASVVGDGTATLVMDGPGPAIHLVGTHQGTADPATVDAAVWRRQRAPLVDALEIVGAHPEAVGVRAEGTMQTTLTRLVVRGMRHAIHLPGRNRNVIIANCHLYENRGVGVFMEGADLHQINVVGSHISYNGGGGIVVRASEVRNLHVGTSDIESNMDPDGPPTANILLDTREGRVREGSIVGNTIQHRHDAPGSANIRMVGRAMDPPQTVGRFSISDNALSDVAVNIHLLHARGVSITGNVIWKGYEHNLLVEHSAHVVLSANTFERNPDYGADQAGDDLVFVDSEYGALSGDLLYRTGPAPAALTLRRCRWFNVTGVTIVDPERAGLLLDDVAYTNVTGSSIRAPVAVRITGGEANQIRNNILVGRTDVAPGTAVVEDNVSGR